MQPQSNTIVYQQHIPVKKLTYKYASGYSKSMSHFVSLQKRIDHPKISGTASCHADNENVVACVAQNNFQRNEWLHFPYKGSARAYPKAVFRNICQKLNKSHERKAH